jgi:beta-lactamase regulating signal transducer with metallopeptidase domain
MPLTAFMQTMIQVVVEWMPAAVESVAAGFRALSQQAAPIAVAAVWQGAVIAIGLAVLLQLAPRTSAEHRFRIWAAAFIALAGLPLLTLIAKFSGAVVSGGFSGAAEAAAQPMLNRPWMGIDARWSLPIAAIWIAATLFRGVDLAVHSMRLRTLWAEAIPVELHSQLTPMLAPVAATWHCKAVEVCTTTTLQRPSVIGFLKPRILIPDWLFARLTAGELEQIVLHEAEHLRRHDDWTNLLQKLCLVLFPLNPALVWIEHRLCREREMACDEGVVRITGAPRAYAACLASLAERGLERRVEALSLGAWQQRPELVQRVHSILRRTHTLGPLGNGALLGALGCSLLFGSIELARCPQLIAFVPAGSEDGHALAAKQTAPALVRAAGPRFGNTGFDAAYLRTRSAGAGRGSSAVYATEVEAILPASGWPRSADARAAMQDNEVKQSATPISMTPTYKHDLQSPRAIQLKAEMPSAQSEPAPEQWIVVAVWEQVQSSNQSAGLRADYETGANASGDGQNKIAGNDDAGSQTAGQFTVTRLIFRILPASSNADSKSTQPSIVPTRNGWLVLQL